jgi:hypothetical protein
VAILALDAAWSGCGWALVDDRTVIDVGHVALGGRTWRWAALRDWLEADYEPLLQELALRGGRVVVEEPPPVYSGAKRKGNQAATGYGIGTLTGPLLLHACRDDLDYPWTVTPDVWRAWWNLKGKGRTEKKRVAIAMCRQLGHGLLLVPFPEIGEDLAPRSDVAEAILIGLGACRHLNEAPKGPKLVARPATTEVLFPATTRTK